MLWYGDIFFTHFEATAFLRIVADHVHTFMTAVNLIYLKHLIICKVNVFTVFTV